MAYFSCMAGVGGKGNSVIVTCDVDFAGIPITCTNGQKTYTKVCPSFSPYEVTFSGLVAGTWTISATVDGVVYSTTAVVTDITAVLSYGFNWQMWVDSSSSLHSEDYNDLSDLLSNEAAIRQLFTEHAPTDYVASTATVTPDLATVLNNDLCAKWINLRDYALDTLYANEIIADYMDEADKYFYGEWVITDNTTTPPTWGAKGNVPIMTANNAPYGEAIGEISSGQKYMPFNGVRTLDGADCRMALYGYVGYKFTNPVSVRALDFLNAKNEIYSKASDFDLIYSDDGTNWSTANAYTNIPDETLQRLKSSDKGYHLYWAIQAKNTNNEAGTSGVFRCHALQFYGRELSVSVPVMTSNTVPFGEAFGAGLYGSSQAFYRCFTGETKSDAASFVPNGYCGYDFGKTVVLDGYIFIYNDSSSDTITYKVQYSNDKTNWTDIFDTNPSLTPKTTIKRVLDSEIECKYVRLLLLTTTGAAAYVAFTVYGKDYSEKEFETGTTKKWLYDHGVELETMQTQTSGTGAIVTKEDSHIYLYKPSNGTNAMFYFPTLDITDYDLLRGKLDDMWYEANESGSNTSFMVTNLTTTDMATLLFHGSKTNFPNNLALDVSSISGNISQGFYVAVMTGGGGTISYFSIKELWLE